MRYRYLLGVKWSQVQILSARPKKWVLTCDNRVTLLSGSMGRPPTGETSRVPAAYSMDPCGGALGRSTARHARYARLYTLSGSAGGAVLVPKLSAGQVG